jgi:A/G-specific adenine glycosylase
MAAASPAAVIRDWRGLGYNRRALALHRAATAMVERHGGRVPDTLDELVALPGIGRYTARAVLSIAFDRPVAALDTNIRRVLSRAFLGETPSPRRFQELGDATVPRDEAATWTHALMDIGAAFCRPREPRCDECPLRTWCRFVATGATGATVAPPKRRATRFESTTRWLRGRILDRLRDAVNGEPVTFDQPIGEHALPAVLGALAAMARDGVIVLEEPAGSGRAVLPGSASSRRSGSDVARPRDQRADGGNAEEPADAPAVRGDLAVQRLQERVAEWVVREDREQAPPTDQPAGGERRPGAGENLAVGSDEVQAHAKVALGDRGREPGIRPDLLQRDQPEPVRRGALREPRRRGDAQAAVGVVEQGSRSIHVRTIIPRSPDRRPRWHTVRRAPPISARATSTGRALGYASIVRVTSIPAAAGRTPIPEAAPGDGAPLPADDPTLFDLDLRELRERWAATAARPAIGAAAMTGMDLKAQKLGVPGQRLMEHAGVAVAAATKAIAEATERWGKGTILILCGPGNNGGDGFVAARYLAKAGAHVAAVLVSTSATPATADATRNWNRLDRAARVSRIHVTTGLELKVLAKDIDRASVVVDALLGTGVHGELRDPIRSAVELILAARKAKVPIVAVDTPTAVELTSGDASSPVVRADLTVTFHRPKTGLLTKRGAALAGKVLVAPIGIPREADRG